MYNRGVAYPVSLLGVLLVCLAPVGLRADTIIVRADGGGDYPTIQAALDAATAHDEIVLDPGTYTGDGNRDLDFAGKAVTVRSTDPTDPAVVAATVISCQGTADHTHRGFDFHSGEGADSILDGLTVTGGHLTISGDTSPNGGGILCTASSPTIRRCTITGNIADRGAGVFVDASGSVLIVGCLFSDNRAETNGGGFAGADTDIVNCTFVGNRATSGGGLSLTDGRLVNSLVRGNFAQSGAGIVANGAPQVLHCTIAFNSATGGPGGGVIVGDSTGTTIQNSILWGPTSDLVDFIGFGEVPPSVTYSCVDGGWPGQGNTGADPRYVDATNGDFSLRPASPAIDTADVAALPADFADLDGDGDTDEPIPFDLAGQPRMLGDAPDMGAYEYDPQADFDNDGVVNADDNCPLVANSDQADSDGDGLADACDNCPGLANADQADFDVDAIGGACDACDDDPDNDFDGDGICGDVDNCPDTANADQADVDADAIGDACDAQPDVCDDLDEDGTCGIDDACPQDANKTEAGICGCDVGDIDTNEDGAPDCQDPPDGLWIGTTSQGWPISFRVSRGGTIISKILVQFTWQGYGDSEPTSGWMLEDDSPIQEDGSFVKANVTNTSGDGVSGRLLTSTTADGDAYFYFRSIGSTSVTWKAGRDGDEDGVVDDGDNCPSAANSDQDDADIDGAGDACDETPEPPCGCDDGSGLRALFSLCGAGFSEMLVLCAAGLLLMRRIIS